MSLSWPMNLWDLRVRRESPEGFWLRFENDGLMMRDREGWTPQGTSVPLETVAAQLDG